MSLAREGQGLRPRLRPLSRDALVSRPPAVPGHGLPDARGGWRTRRDQEWLGENEVRSSPGRARWSWAPSTRGLTSTPCRTSRAAMSIRGSVAGTPSRTSATSGLCATTLATSRRSSRGACCWTSRASGALRRLPAHDPIGASELQSVCCRAGGFGFGWRRGPGAHGLPERLARPGLHRRARAGRHRPRGRAVARRAGRRRRGRRHRVARGPARPPCPATRIRSTSHCLVERGIFILEMVNCEELARDRVYEFCFMCLPLSIRGATGSMVRPVAVV